MGCDFELLIQVQYGSYWVTIMEFGTKTRCGGYPLCPAMRIVAETKGIVGDYGLQYPTLASDVDPISFIISQDVKGSIKSTENTQIDAQQGEEAAVETADAGGDDDDETGSQNDGDESVNAALREDEGEEQAEETDKEYEVRNEKERLYYSKNQFEELIKCIKPIEGMLYNKIMAPVPTWCDMALIALPLTCGEIWMSGDPDKIQDTTDLLAVKQKELAALYKEAYTKVTAMCKLPVEVVCLIGEFAVGGLDVRVAFKDEEGQSGKVRQGDFGGANEQPECIVM